MDRLASPLESLVDFCSDLHEKGITAEQTVVSTQTDKAELPFEDDGWTSISIGIEKQYLKETKRIGLFLLN